jgi:hypothetical protein
MGNTCSTCSDQEKGTDQQTNGHQDQQQLRPAGMNKSAKPADRSVGHDKLELQRPIDEPKVTEGVKDLNPAHQDTPAASHGQKQVLDPQVMEAKPVEVKNPYVEPRAWQVVKSLHQSNVIAEKTFKRVPKRDPKSFMDGRTTYSLAVTKTVLHSQTSASFQGTVNEKDEPSGWGLMVLRNGELIEGMFEAGKPIKHLRYFNQEGCMLDGDISFPVSKLNGSGTLLKSDGYKITCLTWVNGVYTGEIVETDASGKQVFSGRKTANGQKQGQCEVVFGNFTIKGNFKDDVPIGTVRKIYADGKIYDGEINKEMQEEGKGTLTFIDGRKFSGPFSKGLANGEGQFTTDSGKVITQNWKNGQRV